MKIGIIREGKVPPDKRVPLSPDQCLRLKELYPKLEIYVQPSPIRAFKDEEYSEKGMKLNEDLSHCDVLFGVKEVQIKDLIPNKKYFFFSHTFKKQPYNRDLLRNILERKIQLIDYEVLKAKGGKRVIGFGRYAGIVGCYNALKLFGLKHNLYDLKSAHLCEDRKEVERELKKVSLPEGAKIVLTGYGRVGNGAREILSQIPVKEVSPEEYLNEEFKEPVFTHLEVDDYYERQDGAEFIKKEFYNSPEKFKCVFNKYTPSSDLYIPCHYWSSDAEFILTQEAIKKSKRLKVVGDISCDIDGPIACTIRPSKISDPFYGYNPETGEEANWKEDGIVAVTAVDNLPCELPKDASVDFGEELIKHVFPQLLGGDEDGLIDRASETSLEGKLTPHFEYLTAYVEGRE